MKSPKAKSINVVCDVCGLDWTKHTDRMKTSSAKPTLETCVELLKAELARRPQFAYSGTNAAPAYRFTYPSNLPTN